ncbi:ATP-binding protein [Alteromonas sp. 1_MG-2023]|uniref:ATP-binding protein n=1 Tax=Alteromonas sp. 1_MG-2023 TaxID=3062669 RepID=UPI0026E23E6C|nr:ATP-binding protein [Alteromonas sp. 1_MG-2023]MDO6474017.1 ATP-binding protein [Alteromonas sp. 1_MG-2023]
MNTNKCEDEKIHLIESVQTFGYLLAVDPVSCQVKVTSENLSDILAAPVYPGQSCFTDIVEMPDNGQEILSSLYEQARNTDRRHSYEWTFKNKIYKDGEWHQLVSSVIYASGELLVVELEPSPVLAGSVSSKWTPTDTDIRPLLPSLFDLPTVEAVADKIASAMREFIGFDRVVVYKFDKDYAGEVIGEDCHEDLVPFKGLKFPASDIPSQARALYVKNMVRCVYDTDETPVKLIPSLSESQRSPLDLSLSMIRGVSPVHLQYMRNMGIRASFSVSLIYENKLWGMIACHHRAPKYVEQRRRLICESLSQVFTYQMHGKSIEVKRNSYQTRQQHLNRIINTLTNKSNPLDGIKEVQAALLNTMRVCGVAVVTPNSHYLIGRTPSFETVSHLFHNYAKDSNGESKTTALTRISDDIIANFKLNGVRGLFISPVSSRHGYYTMWFREPVDTTIRWAGKAASESDVNKSLTPRDSFDTYIESVVDQSKDWSTDDTLLIESFEQLFIPYALGMKSSLDSQVAKLEELDKAKDQFLASISHELRTPLNSIMGWTDLALMDTSNHERLVEALNVVKRASSTQADLINDILDMSRIISGTMKLSVQSVSVSEAVQEVAKQFEAGFVAKNIKLNGYYQDEHTTILADKVRIKQVVHNLLSNALKFTPKGGCVTISGAREHSNYKLFVRDTGKGLSEEQQAHVFERFYQGKASHNKQGLGLGLSIVKSIVEMHGGDIWVSSDGEGMGTTFYVTIPIAPVASPLPKTQATDVVEGSAAHSDRLSGLRILVAEDEEDARKFLRLFLESHGAQVTLAKNGLVAWRILNETPLAFNLLLSDIGMPELDGIGYITKIRGSEHKEIREFNAVALTAYAYTADRVKALKAGFSNYVSKPVDAEELLTVLEMYKPEGE